MSGLAQNFDLTNGINILRLICGLFFIPHIVGSPIEKTPAAHLYVNTMDRRSHNPRS